MSSVVQMNDHLLVTLPSLGAPMPIRPCPEGDPSPLHSIAMEAVGGGTKC